MASNGNSRASSAVEGIEDPFLRRSIKGALHLRRYMPFYVFGLIWVLTLALFPSIRDGGGDDVSADGTGFAGDAGTSLADTGASTSEATSDPGAAATDAGAAPTAGGTTSSGGAAAPTAKPGAGATGTATGAVAAPTNQPISAETATGAIQRGTGTTRDGRPCTPETRQVPFSSYAIPCQNKYDGPNGGATFRGVTDKEITIVRRKFPESANSRAVAEVNAQAGYASADTTEEVRKTFIEYFNKTYELYGRQVKYVVYESKNNASSTDEAQSKGKELACLDAEDVKGLNAFGTLSGTPPFSECAAERGIPVFAASAYHPETYYRKYHPFMWHTVMECERISYQVAEYIGKRLHGKPAKWAGDPVLQAKTRHFGTYVPDNDAYQSCVKITQRELKSKYGVTDTGPQYNYQLDISRFPDQAAQASVQFSAAGVTTVILACDYISTTVLTAAAEQQRWRPEWLQIGTALNDADNSARLFHQGQVNGHLFGPSQLGATTKLIGENSEPGQVYKAATGKVIPEGTSGDYFSVVLMFNLLQAAGPNLTPAAIGAGAKTIPPGGAPDFPLGYWSLVDGPDGTEGAGDHTTIDDSREIFWVSQGCQTTCTDASNASDPYYRGPDGNAGTYKETYGGKRFRNGEWPKEDPPIYPPR